MQGIDGWDFIAEDYVGELGFGNTGLSGIWFNFVGVNILAAILSAVFLVSLSREIKRRESESEPLTQENALK